MKIIFIKIVAVLGYCSIILLLGGCGDKYSEQGNQLSSSIKSELINLGFCSTPMDCIDKLDIYGGHDTQVNFEIYNAENREMIAAFINYSVLNGLEITNGIPITIKVYPKHRYEYGNNIFKDKPIIYVKISG